jgi:hypothetical protein
MVVSGGGPRFDESLASVAQGLHLVPIVACAIVGSLVLFVWLERRGRHHWARVPTARGESGDGPYRSGSFVAGHLRRAPPLVRVASFGCLLFAHVFAPLIPLALISFPFDGIAIPLAPGIALVLLNWCCAWLLLGRSPHAESAARMGAKASLVANVGLLCLAAFHLVTVELGRRDGIEHACSSSVTFVVFVFAFASIAQALVTVAALREHAPVLGWRATPSEPLFVKGVEAGLG